MPRTRTPILLAAGAVLATALASGAHDGHHGVERVRHADRALRGGTCTSHAGDRYRIVDAISLRRAARRDLDRLPLHRERLGFMDTPIVVERYDEPIEPVLYSVERRIAEEEAREAAVQPEAAPADESSE